MEEMRFDGRVAVITGGGRGLGRSYALLLARRGASIVVNDVGAGLGGDGGDAGPAQQVVDEIVALGGAAVACTDSVATPDGGRAIVQAALDTFGRIDILIHSAGNVRRSALRDMTDADFGAVIDVHLRGAFHVVRAALAPMCDAGFGRIILTASINGLYGKSDVGNYATAKAGLIGLSHTAGIEGAPFGVTSNVIVPAAVTRMSEGVDVSAFPPMDPEQVAPLVGWLAHESCTVTGEMLIAMGGRMARAYLAESPGVFQPNWTVEEVAARSDSIRDTGAPVVFAPVPDGQLDHLRYGFNAIRAGGG